MTILEYYIKQQENALWVKKFQSTSNEQSGKTFSYVNTNFRKLSSFFKQLEEFEVNDGKSRENWRIQHSHKQEVDKHRVVNLRNSKLIEFDGNKYNFTSIGYTLLDLNKTNLDENSKWILLLMLILDYGTDERDLDIIETCNDVVTKLTSHNIEHNSLLSLIKDGINTETLDELFRTPIFWLLTFYKDKKFIEEYLKSTDVEKNKLSSYLIQEHNKKASKDCLAHKFINSGAYNITTFKEDLKVLYVVSKTLVKDNNDFESYKGNIISSYREIVSINQRQFNEIEDFIKSNKSIFKYVYTQLKLNEGDN